MKWPLSWHSSIAMANPTCLYTARGQIGLEFIECQCVTCADGPPSCSNPSPADSPWAIADMNQPGRNTPQATDKKNSNKKLRVSTSKFLSSDKTYQFYIKKCNI